MIMFRIYLLLVLVHFGSLNAQTLKLTIGEELPKDAEQVLVSSGFKKIEDTQRFLVTPSREIGFRYKIFKCEKHQCLIGWDESAFGLRNLYLIANKTNWNYDQDWSKKLQLPVGSSLEFNCKSAEYVITGVLKEIKQSEQGGADQPANVPQSKSPDNSIPNPDSKPRPQ
jgi:hypothetical protein